MSGWDWIHAGLEVATYSKAQKAQSDLAEMKTASQMEAARRALLEAMRSFVFDIYRDIQLAEDQVQDYPQQVYIVSRALDWRLKDSSLSADTFPDFQDKEYVFKTQKKISEVINKSKSGLTQEQIQQSETAVQYIAEIPLLQQAITDKSAQESLKSTNEQWQKLKGIQGKKNLFLWLGILGLGLSACVGLPLALSGIAQLGSGDFGNAIGGLLILGIGAAIPVGSFAAFILGGKSNPDFAPLKAKREGWLKQLIAKETRQEIFSKFGDLSSEQFQKNYEERIAFLNPLLGSDFQKYLEPGK
jgi:hypothetical protein